MTQAEMELVRDAFNDMRAEIQTVVLGLTETMGHLLKVTVDIAELDREAFAGALLVDIEQKSPIAKSIISGVAAGLTRPSTTPPSLTVIKGDKADPT